MGIDKYTYFIEDVKLYLKSIIDKYDFKVSLDLETDSTQAVFLHNDYCKIWLSTLVTFPYPYVSFDIFIKDTKIESVEVLNYWNISMKQFDKIYLEIERSIDYPTDDEFSCYQKSLIENNVLLTNYYIPFIMSGIL